MRSSKKSTMIVFIIIIGVLFVAILFNYLHTQMSKNAAKNYVPIIKKHSQKTGDSSTQSNNPAQTFTLKGPITEGKSVSELGFKPGFYDVHLTGGQTQYLSTTGLTTKRDEYGHIVSATDPVYLEQNRQAVFTPAKFSPLKKQGESYVITNPGNYLPEIQLPVGEYEVTYQGNLVSQEVSATAKAGSMLSISTTTYQGTVIPKSTEKDNFNVTMYEAQGKDSGHKSGMLAVQKNRLVSVVMMNVSDENVSIVLTPVNK
ncbi:hypothetical protein AB3K25_00520 [Leuconostoc sp. MS02]|uniref:Lipoprotein n=1 Tax=Leuconostoc aquikimchii TaxID=3236804 RepID=A0ABV3S531_9LACO